MRIALLFFLFLISSYCFAQKKDSLKIIWNDTSLPDTSRVWAGNKLADAYNDQPSDSSIQIGIQNLALAYQSKNDKAIRLTLYQLAISYHRFKKLDKALEYYLESLPYFFRVNDAYHASITLHRIGSCYYNRFKIDTALMYYQKAIDALPENKEKSAENWFLLHQKIAVIHKEKGEYGESVKHFLKADSINRHLAKDINNNILINLEIGRLYGDQKNRKKKLEYFNKAKSFFTKEGVDEYYRHLVYSDLSIAHRELGMLDSAIYYSHKALDIATKNKWYTSIAYIHMHLNRFFKAAGNYSKAAEHALEAIKYSELTANKTLTAQNTAEAGLVYSTLKQYKKALAYCNKIKDYENLDQYTKTRTCNCFYNAYIGLGDYKNALKYREMLVLLNDSIDNKENYQKVVELEEQLKYQEKEEKIVREKALLEKEKEQQRNILLSISVLALIILSFLLVIYSSKQKTKKQKEKIELLLKEIHHRVKNNLQLISSLLDLQQQDIKDSAVEAVFEEGKSRVETMALLHQKLYQHENLNVIEFRKFLQELFAVYAGSNKKVQLQNDAPILELDIDIAIPLGLISNEIITNAFKYAFKGNDNPKLKVAMLNIENNYELIISDNGPGLSEDFNSDKYDSLGMRLIKDLSFQLGGEAYYTKNEDWNSFHIKFKGNIHQ